jgi:hypothetical protein
MRIRELTLPLVSAHCFTESTFTSLLEQCDSYPTLARYARLDVVLVRLSHA